MSPANDNDGRLFIFGLVLERHWSTVALAPTGALAPSPVDVRCQRDLVPRHRRILRSPNFSVVK